MRNHKRSACYLFYSNQPLPASGQMQLFLQRLLQHLGEIDPAFHRLRIQPRRQRHRAFYRFIDRPIRIDGIYTSTIIVY